MTAARKHKPTTATRTVRNAGQKLAHTQLLPVAAIKVGKRHRKDFGDLTSLARSIDARGGLLQPVLITSDRELVAGERRLRAWPLTKFREQPIPVYRLDVDSIVAGEHDENALRKPFTPSELVAIEKKLKPMMEQAVAKAANDRSTKDRAAPGRKAKPGSSPGRVAEKVAKFAGVDRRTLDKARAVVEAAEENPERFGKLKTDMDRTSRVHGPYKRLQNMLQADVLRAAPPPVPMQGPYGGVVIDVPWPQEADAAQEDIDAAGRSLRPYAAMSIQTACRFLAEKVKPILGQNSVVGLWTTNHHMRHAFQCLHALGIDQHSTILTWEKDKMGRGQVLRDKTEHLIIGLIGKPVITLTNQTTILKAPRRENSQKPDEVYALFEEVFPATRYAEIFSRGGRGERWDCHGDQVGKFAPAEPPADADGELADPSIEDAQLPTILQNHGQLAPPAPGRIDLKPVAESMSRNRAEAETEHEQAMGMLPEDPAALTALYRIALADFDAAVVAGEEDIVHALQWQLEQIEVKANGGKHTGMRSEDSSAEPMRMAAAAPMGTAPGWGQRGFFRLVLDDMPVIVSHDERLGIEAYAEDASRPFICESGYRSLHPLGYPALGLTVAQHAEALIRNAITCELYPRTGETRARQHPLPFPTTVHPMPTSWDKPVDHRASSEAAPIGADADRACRVCGCTEDNACPCDEHGARVSEEAAVRGCHWVGDDLCSACASAPRETSPADDGLGIPEILRRGKP